MNKGKKQLPTKPIKAQSKGKPVDNSPQEPYVLPEEYSNATTEFGSMVKELMEISKRVGNNGRDLELVSEELLELVGLQNKEYSIELLSMAQCGKSSVKYKEIYMDNSESDNIDYLLIKKLE